jgi:hypothetical protein
VNLENERELEVTKDKLRLLEERYDVSRRDKIGDARVRELSQRSLKRLTSQLKAEIVRYEAHRDEQAANKI